MRIRAGKEGNDTKRKRVKLIEQRAKSKEERGTRNEERGQREAGGGRDPYGLWARGCCALPLSLPDLDLSSGGSMWEDCGLLPWDAPGWRTGLLQ